jgi:hypothetical protein
MKTLRERSFLKKRIAGRTCYIYECEPSDILLIQPVDDHDVEVLDSEVFLIPAAWLEENEITHYDLAETPDEDLPEKLLEYLSHYGSYRNTGETDYIEYEGHGIWGLTAKIIHEVVP